MVNQFGSIVNEQWTYVWSASILFYICQSCLYWFIKWIEIRWSKKMYTHQLKYYPFWFILLSFGSNWSIWFIERSRHLHFFSDWIKSVKIKEHSSKNSKASRVSRANYVGFTYSYLVMISEQNKTVQNNFSKKLIGISWKRWRKGLVEKKEEKNHKFYSGTLVNSV